MINNKKRVGVLFVVAVLFLFCLTPALADPEFYIEQPEDNRTFPYTTNLELDTSTNATTCTDCYYQIHWFGDSAGHADDTYPEFTYDWVSINCDDIASGDVLFSVDFDGQYTITANGTCDQYFLSDTNDFYVDRDEMEQSRPLTSIFIILGILGIAFLLGFIAKSLSETHVVMRLYLLFVQLFLGVISIYGFYGVSREYLKVPLINSSVNIVLYTFLWGVIVVSVAYFVIYLMKTLFETFKQKKEKDGVFLEQ